MPVTPDDLDDTDAGLPGEEATRVVIPDAQAGARLDQALAALLPQCSRSRLQRLLKNGHVIGPDGTPVMRSAILVAEGETYLVDVPAPAPVTVEPQALPLDVVYEDADLLVVI